MKRALLITILALAAARADAGQVVDPTGAPIAKAEACLVAANVEQLCVDTDAEGRYELPGGERVEIRIRARGFLPAVVTPDAAAAHAVVLERAASLKVRLLDRATGKAIPKGKAVLVYTSGSKLGPFPSGPSGVSIGTLVPGEAHLLGSADGYAEMSGPSFVLSAGKTLDASIELDREPAQSGK